MYYLEVPPSLFGPIVEQLALSEDDHEQGRGSAAAARRPTRKVIFEAQRDDQLRQRAGKAMPHRAPEVRLLLRPTPRLAFLSTSGRADSNQIVLRIDPSPGMRLQLAALACESWRAVHLDSSFVRDLGEPMEPYERLLHAAITGDHQPSPGRTALRRRGA